MNLTNTNLMDAEAVLHKIFKDLLNDDVVPQIGMVLSLIVCEAVISTKCIQAIQQGNVSAYQDKNSIYLDFKLESGWTDRRLLGDVSVGYLRLNSGPRLDTNFNKKISQFLEEYFPEVDAKYRLSNLINISKAFWSVRLPGVLFSHCCGEDRFQLLPNHALWRRATKCCPEINFHAAQLDSYFEIRVQTLSTTSAELVVRGFSKIVSSKVSKLVARSKMLELAGELIPLAKLEGRAQTIGLTALVEVLKFGGLRGEVLSPVSIAQYTAVIFLKFIGQLIALEGAEEASTFEVAYRKVIGACIPTQQGKAAALVQALHNRLILRGAPPLHRPISSKTPQIIPAAAVIWPHELELAKDYVCKISTDDRVEMQALLCLQLGEEIPLRTYEYFSFKLRDILRDGANEVVVAPARSMDKDKSIHSRMRHEIEDPECISSLQEFKQMRLREDELPGGGANPDRPLFGKPGQAKAYKQEETLDLINRALKWATGNPTASLYDLRHAVISRRALNVLSGTNQTDMVEWDQLSRGCGQGTASATQFYIHQVEEPLSKLLHEELQCEIRANQPPGHFQIAELAALYGIRPRPEIIDDSDHGATLEFSKFGFMHVNALLKNLTRGMNTDYLLKAHSISETELNQATEAAEKGWIKAAYRLRTARERRLWLRDYFVQSCDSKQLKFSPVIVYLEKLVEEQTWGHLRQIYRAAWECVDTHEVDLARGHYALEIVQLLLDAGCKKSQLYVKCTDTKSTVAKELKALCGNVYPQSPRRGRAFARLFLLPDGVSAEASSGATISIGGLYWLLCVLGCLLYIRGEY